MVFYDLANNCSLDILCSRLYFEDSPIVKEELTPFKRQDTASNVPLLDQHFAVLVSSPLTWIIPASMLAITLRFDEPLVEFANLVIGLISNILQSMIGIDYHIISIFITEKVNI